jgi:ubiquinone/menaquinone biosynthesis C-methylase UbiE
MAENLSDQDNNARFVEYPYDLHKTWWNDMQHRKMRALCARIHASEKILDVGCNSGYVQEFVPKSCEVHGVDLSPTLVEIAKTRYVSAQVAGADALPFPDKSFDVVILAGVIEYVFDPNQVMQELARVARRMILIEANHPLGVWGTHRIPSHEYMVRSYTEETCQDLLETVGKVTWKEIIEGHGQKQHMCFEVTL